MARRAASLVAEQFVEDGGRTGPPVRPQRIPGYYPATMPSMPSIQSSGVTARGRIEHQQSSASAESTALGGGEERCADTLSTYSSMHKHLRDVPARHTRGRVQPIR